MRGFYRKRAYEMKHRQRAYKCYNPESQLKLIRNKYLGNTIMLAVKLKMNGLTWGLNKEGIHLF